jgi:acyl-CoA thioester hydrolase
MNFPVELRLPVLWGYMDAMGHVNNTVYFRFFESARVEYMSSMGLFARQDERDEVVPILASTKCDYKIPLTYPDEVLIRARTTKVGNTSFTQAYEIYSTAQAAVSATGEGIIVCVDRKSGKPVPVPDDVRAAIEKAEAPRP